MLGVSKSLDGCEDLATFLFPTAAAVRFSQCEDPPTLRVLYNLERNPHFHRLYQSDRYRV
jgi:hypothetical protein